jgi:hypothetical protein
VPGGSDYFHNFSYLADAATGPNNSLTIVSPMGPSKLMLDHQFMPMSFSESASIEGDLVFAGYGITAPDLKYDDYDGIDATGKIVVIMRYSPDEDNPHGEFSQHASWSKKVINARAHGAIGIIFITRPNDPEELPQVHFDRNYINSGLPSVVALSSVFHEVRGFGVRSLAQIQAMIDSTRKPQSFIINGFRARMNTDVNLIRVMVPNVVGMIRGSDPKLAEEMIFIGAHLDHLGLGGEGSLYAGRDAAIHHGADDNASGVAGMLALAATFAKSGSPRTLVFMGFNGEEEGLLGSEAFLKDPPIPLKNIAAMINLDMIGRLDSNSLIVQGTGTSPRWDTILTELNTDRFTLKRTKDGYGPSDHSSFYSKDLPVLAFFTGLHTDYHRPSDTWEKINYEGEARIVEFVADVVRSLNRYPDRPAFTKVASSTPRSSAVFRVYVGTIPDYAYDGKGLRLTGVAPGGPAEKAGIEAGDIIVKMGGREINNIYDYTAALSEFKPKQEVETEVMRDDKIVKMTVVMGSR